MKRLRKILLTCASVGAILIGSAGPAAADPISTAIALALPIGTASAVAAVVVNAFWFTVQSLAVMAINKLTGQRQDGQRRQQSILSLSLGEVPREVLFGEAVTGGSLVNPFNDGGKHGTDNETLVIAVADHKCHSLVSVFVDDKEIAFTGDGPVAGQDGLSIYWRDGSAGQTFPASLRSAAGYTTNDVLASVAYVVIRCSADWMTERGGRAAFRMRVKGKLCYDPSKDSTVEGGSGPHRWYDPSTWEWTNNAKVCQYNYDRGIYALDQVSQPAQLLIGRGLTALEAPPARQIPGIALCNENVALKAGGTEKRYTVGGVIRGDTPFVDVAQMFADAMGGVIIQPEGGFDVEPGAPRSVVAEITDDDLIVLEKVIFRDRREGSNLVNSVIGHYVEPSQGWTDHSAPVRRSIDDIIADGGPEEEVFPMPLVTSGTQAQRITEARRRKHRLEKTASICLGPRFNWLEEGDWIGWTSPRWLGGERVVFRIDSHLIDEARRIRLGLEEIEAGVWGWDEAADEVAPGSTAGGATTPPPPLDLEDVDVAAGQAGGVPFLKFTWATPVDPAVFAVSAQARVKGTTDIAAVMSRTPNEGTLYLTNGVAPGVTMEGRLVAIGPIGRDAVASDWIEVVVPGLTAGDTGVDTSAPTTNHAPSVYRARGVRTSVEQKTRATLGVTGSGTQYGVLTTSVSSASTSVPIQQRFVFTPSGSLSVAWERASTSESDWGAWAPVFSQHRPPNLGGSDVVGNLPDLGRIDSRDLAQLTGRTANHLTYVGGGGATVEALRPAEGSANVTETRVAAFVAGQGDFATLSLLSLTDSRLTNKSLANLDAPANTKLGGIATGATVGARAGTNLVRADGATILSQADVRTIEGTALFLNNQGALATQNTVLPTQFLPTGDSRIVDVDFVQDAYWLVSAPARGITIDRSHSSLAVMGAIGGIRAEAAGTNSQLTGSALPNPYYEVVPGEVWHFKAQRFWSTGFNGQVQVRIYYYNSAKGLITQNTIYNVDMRAAPSPGNVYGEITATWKAPAGAAYARVYLMFVIWPTAVVSVGRYIIAKPQFRPALTLGATSRLLLADGVTPATNNALVTAQGRSGGVNPGGIKRQSNGAETLMAGQPFKLAVADGEVVSFSPAFAVAPAITFDLNQLDGMASGEHYRVRALDPTGSGFTVSAKIITPGSGATYTSYSDDSPAVTGSGTSLERQKATSGVAHDRKYTFTAGWQADVYAVLLDGFPESMSTVIRIWALARRGSGDAWTAGGFEDRVCGRPTSGMTTYSGTVEIEADFSQWDTFNVHGGTEWRVEIEVLSTLLGSGDTARVVNFGSVTWTAQTGGGDPSTRSALSEGRKVDAIITPLDG